MVRGMEWSGDQLNVTFASFPIAQEAAWYIKRITHKKRLISEIMVGRERKSKALPIEQHCDYVCMCMSTRELQQL